MSVPKASLVVTGSMDGTAMIWQMPHGAGDATELAPIHVTWKLVSQGFALH